MLDLLSIHRLENADGNSAFGVPLDVARSYCRSAAPDSGIVIDVGAYHGGFASAALSYLDGWVQQAIAFDPLPANIAVMEGRALDPRVTIEQLAVAGVEGEGIFSVPPASYVDAGSSWGGRLVQAVSGGEDTSTVQCVTLDGYLTERHLPSPLLVKIDVQGGEWEVISGLAERVRETPFLYFECQLKAGRDFPWVEATRSLDFEVLMDGFQFGPAFGVTEDDLDRTCEGLGIRVTRKESALVWYGHSIDGDRFLPEILTPGETADRFLYFQTDLFCVNRRFPEAIAALETYLSRG